MAKKRRQRGKSRPSAGRTRPSVSARPKSPVRAAAPEDAEPRARVIHFNLGDRSVGGDRQRGRIENQVARLVNDVRRRAGLSTLTTDERLRRSARLHSADMAARGYFAHQSPDGSQPFDRMLAAGYPDGAAENIARGQQHADSVMQAWMNSPGHRRNILHPDFQTIGVGVHLTPDGPWWTQHFGY